MKFDDLISFEDMNLDTHVQGFYQSKIIDWVKENIDWIHALGEFQEDVGKRLRFESLSYDGKEVKVIFTLIEESE